jgi:ATP-dependent protease Clp ATPase subunit
MNDFACSFCGTPRLEVRKLISGPLIFICDSCAAVLIQEARDLGVDPLAGPTASATSTAVNEGVSRGLACRFCGRADLETAVILNRRDAHICDGCLTLCNEICVEDIGPAWRETVASRG